jgi:hypothetical protein
VQTGSTSFNPGWKYVQQSNNKDYSFPMHMSTYTNYIWLFLLRFIYWSVSMTILAFNLGLYVCI